MNGEEVERKKGWRGDGGRKRAGKDEEDGMRIRRGKIEEESRK